jgi:hypothetical protein
MQLEKKPCMVTLPQLNCMNHLLTLLFTRYIFGVANIITIPMVWALYPETNQRTLEVRRTPSNEARQSYSR